MERLEKHDAHTGMQNQGRAILRLVSCYNRKPQSGWTLTGFGEACEDNAQRRAIAGYPQVTGNPETNIHDEKTAEIRHEAKHYAR